MQLFVNNTNNCEILERIFYIILIGTILKFFYVEALRFLLMHKDTKYLLTLLFMDKNKKVLSYVQLHPSNGQFNKYFF